MPIRRAAPGFVAGALTAVLLGAVGLVASRPDIAVLGLPLAVAAALAVGARRAAAAPHIEAEQPVIGGDGAARTALRVAAPGAEAIELRVVLGSREQRTLVLAPGEEAEARGRARHSGPWIPVAATSRALDLERSLPGREASERIVEHAVAPRAVPLRELPVPTRLTGMHGAHAGRRAGQGGDVRDVRRFEAGDERRRVDWRATARLSRRAGELYVRRTDALSDASVAIVVDGIDDLGEDVHDWARGDRLGVTSLDLAREAARSIAAAAIETGDRVALHELGRGGRTVRGGAGRRHLARIVAAVTAITPRPAYASRVREPLVSPGSMVYVLSTFLDPQVARFAEGWVRTGHRVVAVDTLPEPDIERLERRERVALRLVLAGRRLALDELAAAGIDVVRWRDADRAALRVAARRRA